MLDLRELMHQTTITVETKHGLKFKNKWLVFLGLRIIKFGCWVCGVNYKSGDSDA